MFSLKNSSLSENVTWFVSEENVSSVGVDFVPEGCVMKKVSLSVPERNEYDLITKEAISIVKLLISAISLPLCFVISFCTNIINMVVFYKQGLKERINLCFFTLSFLDMLYVAVIYGQKSTTPYSFATGKEDQIELGVIFFIQTRLIGLNCLGLASMATSAVIVLERCLCITRPLLVKNLISTKMTALLLWLLLIILICGGFVIDGLRLTVICVFDARDNTTVFQYYPTHFYQENKTVIDIFGGIVFGSLLPGLFVICVIVCTVIIAIKMKKMSVWRETVSSAPNSLSSRDLAVTRMIVATSVLFIVCVVPSVTVRVALNYVPGLRPGGSLENLYIVLVRLYYLSSAINSSYNFFVYYTYGSRFRQTVHQLFSSCASCCNRTTMKNVNDK